MPAERFEVIVADDSCDDATRTVVNERFPRAIWVKGSGRGPAANRNCGAARARGDWLAFIDDDCQPVDGWLGALADQAAAGTVEVIEGRIVAPDKVDSVFSRHVENLTGGNYWSGNLAMRRDLFVRLGGFDEDFKEAGGEDLEFAERIRRSGVPTAFSEAATVIHPSHVVPWRYLFWRAFLIRWHLLYLHKIGQAVPVDAPVWKAFLHIVRTRTAALLRGTLRFPARYRERPRTAIVELPAEWVMFPIVLVYLLYWELRFRSLLAGRQAASCRS
jgi:GT2 family glycosyltransferase